MVPQGGTGHVGVIRDANGAQMSWCFLVYGFVTRNHGNMPLPGACPKKECTHAHIEHVHVVNLAFSIGGVAPRHFMKVADSFLYRRHYV